MPFPRRESQDTPKTHEGLYGRKPPCSHILTGASPRITRYTPPLTDVPLTVHSSIGYPSGDSESRRNQIPAADRFYRS